MGVNLEAPSRGRWEAELDGRGEGVRLDEKKTRAKEEEREREKVVALLSLSSFQNYLEGRREPTRPCS